jgi:hypothetical protein
MTRKDYELIAGVFASFSNICELSETIGADIAQRLAEELESDNPRFNSSRFLAACGLSL